MSEQFVELCWKPHAVTGVSMAEITRSVAEKHEVSVADIKGSGRARWVSQPRQEVMYEIRARTSQSLPAIGRFLGGRNHATILWGIRRHEERIQKGEVAARG